MDLDGFGRKLHRMESERRRIKGGVGGSWQANRTKREIKNYDE